MSKASCSDTKNMAHYETSVRASKKSPYKINVYDDLNRQDRENTLNRLRQQIRTAPSDTEHLLARAEDGMMVAGDFFRDNLLGSPLRNTSYEKIENGQHQRPKTSEISQVSQGSYTNSSLKSESTLLVQPLTLELMNNSVDHTFKQTYEKQINLTSGVLDRAMRAIKHRDLSVEESIVADELEVPGRKNGFSQETPSQFLKRYKNSPLHLGPILHGMRGQYRYEPNIHRGSALSRGADGRPVTRAHAGLHMPYGLVPEKSELDRPLASVDEPVSKSDKLYARQQSLIKKFGVDLWGKQYENERNRAKLAEKKQKQKSIRFKRNKHRNTIYGKQSVSPPKKAKGPSRASPSSLESTRPSLKRPLTTPIRHRESTFSNPSKSNLSQLSRYSASSSKFSPGPESVFNMDMAGLKLPKDKPRKKSKYERRVAKQRREAQKTNHIIEMQTLANRVKHLEIILFEEKEKKKALAHKHAMEKKKKIKKAMSKKRMKQKERLIQKKTFVEMAPFKRSATSATTAMAAALAAAASAERFDIAASRLEDTLGEFGMDDELATTCARAVDRAAKVAGQAINAASTAVAVAATLQNNPKTSHMFSYKGDGDFESNTDGEGNWTNDDTDNEFVHVRERMLKNAMVEKKE